MPELARARLSLCVLLLVTAACGPGTRDPDAPPNIILLIGDDHGYPDFGFMGSEVAQTPHLDRLAQEGTVFPIGYNTSSYCQPSLRTLLTGLEPAGYEMREQITRARGEYQPVIPVLDTLPRALGRAGYASLQAGKYHEGRPEWAGFTQVMANEGGPLGPKLGRGLVRATMAPVFEFIDENQGEPFFVWFAPAVPHLPHNAPPRFRALYEDLGLTEEQRGYFASVSWFDWSVGELVKHLEERGLREHTLLVYLSDNGWDPRPSERGVESWLGGPKGKRSLYELGFRTPIVFSWPGRVPAGATHDDLVSTIDLVPTLLDYAGAPPIAHRSGQSVRPRIEGEPFEARKSIAGSIDALADDPKKGPRGGSFVRTDRWHYLAFGRGADKLFDLENDPDEENNVVDSQKKVRRRLRPRIKYWLQDVRIEAEKDMEAIFAAGGS